jgi:hypothetical protein
MPPLRSRARSVQQQLAAFASAHQDAAHVPHDLLAALLLEESDPLHVRGTHALGGNRLAAVHVPHAPWAGGGSVGGGGRRQLPGGGSGLDATVVLRATGQIGEFRRRWVMGLPGQPGGAGGRDGMAGPSRCSRQAPAVAGHQESQALPPAQASA